MSLADSASTTGWTEMVQLEEAMAASLAAAESVLQRTECLDEEQRAEVHAILQAIRHDTESHVALLGRYVSERAHA